jgi:hypothetical protein
MMACLSFPKGIADVMVKPKMTLVERPSLMTVPKEASNLASSEGKVLRVNGLFVMLVNTALLSTARIKVRILCTVAGTVSV